MRGGRSWPLQRPCQVIGVICSQLLGTESRLNPLAVESGGTEWLITLAHKFGLLIGGTFRFGLLVATLHFALKAYRQSGLAARLGQIDWAILIAFALFVARNVADVLVAIRGGKRPDVWEVAGWPVDPILLVLLAQGLLLFRSSSQMGRGRIGSCWRALSLGVLLTALGDVGMWATNYGYLPWPWSALTWYLWLPAAASFARAPAFQLAVIGDVTSRADRFAPDSPNPL